MKLQFSKKDKIIAGLEVPVNFSYMTNKYGKPYMFPSSDKPKVKFINHCLEYRLTLSEIGELLGVSKQRVYQLHRYGENRLSQSQKKEIKKRDKNKCKICNVKNNLHIHHIRNPRNHNDNNLITLCSSCHRKIDSIYKKEKKISTG